MDESLDVSRETSAGPPDSVIAAYGSAIDSLQRYHDLLATAGVERGLLGPREVPRLWERHILNCAVIEGLVPPGATVADVGSGAGLPGIVLALVRPDITVDLIEPLARRCAFLEEAVSTLGLGDRVSVTRGRAEERRTQHFDVVTARAVAPLDRLARWCLPLVGPGGRLIAIKGSRANEELIEATPSLPQGVSAQVLLCGDGVIEPATTVVVMDMTGSAS